MKPNWHWSNKPESERQHIVNKMAVGWGKKPKTGKWVVCPICGTKKYKKLCHLKRSKTLFCSKECFNKSKKGIIPPNLEQARAKSPIQKGKNNINWKGGVVRPYSDNWTGSLHYKVWQRDNNTCQDCGKRGISRMDLVVHHIDFDKKNCDIDNLILVCRSCHLKRHWKANKGVSGLKSYNSIKLQGGNYV